MDGMQSAHLDLGGIVLQLAIDIDGKGEGGSADAVEAETFGALLFDKEGVGTVAIVDGETIGGGHWGLPREGDDVAFGDAGLGDRKDRRGHRKTAKRVMMRTEWSKRTSDRQQGGEKQKKVVDGDDPCRREWSISESNRLPYDCQSYALAK